MMNGGGTQLQREDFNLPPTLQKKQQKSSNEGTSKLVMNEQVMNLCILFSLYEVVELNCNAN